MAIFSHYIPGRVVFQTIRYILNFRSEAWTRIHVSQRSHSSRNQRKYKFQGSNVVIFRSFGISGYDLRPGLLSKTLFWSATSGLVVIFIFEKFIDKKWPFFIFEKTWLLPWNWENNCVNPSPQRQLYFQIICF